MTLRQEEIGKIVRGQREFFDTGKTLDIDYRIKALNKLRDVIVKYEADINSALRADLGKSSFEGYMCEVGLALSELSYMITHAEKFAAERNVRTPLSQYVARSYVKPCPYGVVLIMSPWNYPFLLTIDPLVDAMAAGNTAVLKPSTYSPNTSEVVEKIVRECFDPDYVAVVTGGRSENSCLFV